MVVTLAGIVNRSRLVVPVKLLLPIVESTLPGSKVIVLMPVAPLNVPISIEATFAGIRRLVMPVENRKRELLSAVILQPGAKVTDVRLVSAANTDLPKSVTELGIVIDPSELAP